jgi:hypothetical protein
MIEKLLLFLNAAYLAEKQQIQILAFGLTWSGLEPTIYRTQGEQANHYTTDVVLQDMILTSAALHHRGPYTDLYL